MRLSTLTCTYRSIPGNNIYTKKSRLVDLTLISFSNPTVTPFVILKVLIELFVVLYIKINDERELF